MASTLNASNSGAGGLISTADASGVLQLQSAGTTAVTVNASQYVGFGTTAPLAKIHMKGNGLSGYAIMEGADPNQWITLGGNFNDPVIGYTSTGALRFGTTTDTVFGGFTERMRIDSSGNVGVGTTPKGWGSPIAGTVIQVGSAAFAANGIIGYCLGNAYYDGTNWKRIASGYGSRLDVSADNGRVTTNTAGTSTADSTITWTAGPYVANLGTSWTNSSDERLKNITGEITDAINKVSQLRAAKFTWKADELNTPQVGLIAQDLQKVLPEVVVVSDKEFDGTAETALGVNYDNVIPLLVAAIQEQQTIINDLTARITALEGAA